MVMILYWCPECRKIYGTNEVRDVGAEEKEYPRIYTHGTEKVLDYGNFERHCPRTHRVEMRGIPDDPDDEAYGQPRCPTCRIVLKPTDRVCPCCGAKVAP